VVLQGLVAAIRNPAGAHPPQHRSGSKAARGVGRAGWASARAAALAWAVAAGLVVASLAATARTPDTPLAVPPVALASLPPEAKATHRLIHQGGPFPYERDGTVFFNRERLLPLERRGFYREYTVRTPGLRHRGARRIVCGGRQPTRPDACYYTADHYSSFQRIVQ
jgi:ribonuclease T1